MEKAFETLEIYGVPRERAKTVSNGIIVLATRYEKEIAALKAMVLAQQSNNSAMDAIASTIDYIEDEIAGHCQPSWRIVINKLRQRHQ